MAYSDRTNAALNVALKRQYNTPLDVSSVFSTLADLDAYVKQNVEYIPAGFTADSPETKFLRGINPYSYVGQIVSVEETSKAYIITAVGTNGTYAQVGTDPVPYDGDEVTVTVDDNNIIALKGFNEVPKGVYTSRYIPHVTYDPMSKEKNFAWGYLDLQQDTEDSNKYTLRIIDSESTTDIGSITLPDVKDMVVQSGELVEIGDETYLKLVIANDEDNPVFIPVGDLINFDIGGKEETNTAITELFKEEGKLYAKADVKVQQVQDNIIQITAGTGNDSGLYVPDITVVERKADLAPTITDNTALVVAQIVKGDTQQTINEEVIEVVTKDILMADDAITNNELSKGLIDPNKVLVEQLVWLESVDGTELEPAPSVQKTLADVLVPAEVNYYMHINEETGEEFLIFQESHAGLITPEEKFKLEKLVIDADGSVGISGTISADNVTGLDDKVIKIVTGADKTADWTPIESGAQVNKIESISLGGEEALPINNKQVAIPIATAQALGVIKSAEAVNKIQVAGATGEAEVYSLSTDKLVQGEQELVLYGGSSGATSNPLTPLTQTLTVNHEDTVYQVSTSETTWTKIIMNTPTMTSLAGNKTATLTVVDSEVRINDTRIKVNGTFDDYVGINDTVVFNDLQYYTTA